MDEEALGRLTEQFDRLVRERLPGAPIERVAVLQYGDDPRIEPGELLGRVYVEAPEGQVEVERERALEAFHDAHRAGIRALRDELNRLPEAGPLEFLLAGEASEKTGVIRLGRRRGGLDTEGLPLVPVMARLGPAELEIVDTLITAGIAANRAEAVRWALARIRERPAYAQLRERARDLEELRRQF